MQMQVKFPPIVFKERFNPYLLGNVLLMLFFLFYLAPGILDAQPKKLYYDLFSVSFPTKNEGWACGRWGTILHSLDGGKTWAPQQSGTDYTLSSISFRDSKNGWVVGDGGTILHTKDGGKSWVKQKSPVPYFLMGVHFANSQKGWIVGERTTILYTEDGGQTWQVQFKDKDFILKSVSFCDERNGWAAGEFGYIYHTENGGITWRQQAGKFRFSEETGEMEGENFLFDVIAITPKTAWVVGIDGYIAKTVDGGTTWQKVTNGIPKAHLFGVTSDRQGTIIIACKGFLLTNSGVGKTFRHARVEPRITYGWIYRIVPKGDGFVAVGKGGWIYLSDKSGLSWNRVVY
jgi:photosystem II stability/assembly factor-like uncharacterized protein